jgi:hypothetical protein
VKTLARIVICSVVAVLAVALFVGQSDAGSPDGNAPSAVDQAKTRMETGQQLFAQGRYADAMKEFEAAYAALPYGAFLYNAALAAEKARDWQRAVAQYERFLQAHPDAPDAPEIRKTVERLKAELSKPAPPPPDAGADAGAGGAAPAEADAGAPDAPQVPADAQTMAEVRSLVFIESEPAGAPLTIYERTNPTAPAFSATGANTGWRKIMEGIQTPKDLSLKVGHYHVVIEGFADYKRSETDISLAPGHVYTFKANLSQGEFLGFLKVVSPVEGAAIYVDDPPPHKHAPWGRTPHSQLIGEGEHQIWVVAKGYVVFTTQVKVEHGKTVETEAKLQRVGYGLVRINGNADEVEIEIDGEPAGVWIAGEPPVQLKLPAGKHQIELDASGRNTYEGEIDVPAGRTIEVHAALVESKDWSKPIVLTLLSGASFVGGYLFMRHADAKLEEAEALQVNDQFDREELDTLERDEGIFRGVSYGMFIGGGVFAAAAIFFYIWDPTDDSIASKGEPREFSDDEAKKSARTHRPRLTPLLGPNLGGLGLSGVF